MNSITEAIAKFTANLKKGSFLVSLMHGCAIVQVHTSEPESHHPVFDEQGNQIGTRWGLPDGHTGWDCTVLNASGDVVGTHVNLGEAIQTAKTHSEAAASGTVDVSDAPAPSPEAPVPAQPHEPQGTAENPQESTGR